MEVRELLFLMVGFGMGAYTAQRDWMEFIICIAFLIVLIIDSRMGGDEELTTSKDSTSIKSKEGK